MRVLFLPNWKIEYCDEVPGDKQPPDYYVEGEDYWFFRYFKNPPQVDVIDIHSFPWLEHFEKNVIRFYIWQALRAIPRLSKYDLVVSHGMQSGVVISLWRRIFKSSSKHIVFDIGAFNSAAESGVALKLMQYASKSIDGIIYHTSKQKDYYREFFPWVLPKSKFIKFGTDSVFFQRKETVDFNSLEGKQYCVCVGYNKRDWDVAVKAFRLASQEGLILLMIGHVDDQYDQIPNIRQIPFIPVKDLISYIEAAKFSILPLKSFNYSYGQMTLLQQMALGKCVIASRVPSLVDYATEGETVVFYEPENPDDLAEKIRMVNSDSDYRDKIGKNASSYVMNICNEKTMAEEIEAYLNHIIES